MRIISLSAIGLCFVAPLLAAQEPTPPAPPAAPAADAACPPGYNCQSMPSRASQVGLYVFPSAGQTKGVQLSEEQQCYDWAQQQTGVDPTKVTANTDSAAKAAGKEASGATQGAAVGGAARGAAAGALIGAAAGDAGKGAAIGAATGAVAGRRGRKRAEAQAEQSGANQAVAVANDKVVQFKKAMSVCLEGKGYTVK
ncbi:MAG TPA: glycine zipper family protein [Gemmatimonadales bacterium]|nr:glycine zipper family protein [Gemmatimonadales bacterium]